MTLDLGAQKRYSLVLAALGHLKSSAEIRASFAERYFEGAWGKDLGFSLPDFCKLHERFERVLKHFQEQRRRQYVLDCLQDGAIEALPADILAVYKQDPELLIDPARSLKLKNELSAGLLNQIRDGERVAPEPRVLSLEVAEVKRQLACIRDAVGSESQRKLDFIVKEMAILEDAAHRSGIGAYGGVKRLRKEQAEEIYKDLLHVRKGESLQVSEGPADPSLIGFMRAIERFVTGESTLQGLVKVIGERLRGVESAKEARVLLAMAKRAARFIPEHANEQVAEVLRSAARRVRLKGQKLPAEIRRALSPVNAKLLLGLKKFVGARAAVGILKQSPNLLGASPEDKAAYLRVVKDFFAEIPAELRDQYSYGRRPDIYLSREGVLGGIAEVRQELQSGRHAAILYRQGVVGIRQFFVDEGIPRPELAAHVLGVLALDANVRRAKDIKESIGSEAAKVSQVTQILDQLCARGWAERVRDEGFKLGVFPSAEMGHLVISAFDKIKGKFPLHSKANAEVAEPAVDKRTAALAEAQSAILALETFKELCTDRIVTGFHEIFGQLDKTKKPGGGGFYINWRPADFTKLRAVRALLEKGRDFRIPALNYLLFNQDDKAFFKFINQAWREVLSEHDQRFGKAFINAMLDKTNRNLLKELNRGLEQRIAKFKVIERALLGQELDLEALKRAESGFSDQGLFAEVMQSRRSGGAHGG
jgi:hypothetical protein